MLTIQAEVGGAPVTIEVQGHGPPIVLVGGAVGRELGAPLARELCSDHAVVNFDYEPHEGWDGQPEGRTCVALADDVVSVLDHVGLARAHVVGISRGAACAYALATRHPARVLSLSLLVPVAPFAGYLDAGAAASPAFADDDQLVASVGRLLFSERFVEEQPDRVRAFILDDPGASVVRVPRGDEQALPRTEVPQVSTRIVTARDDEEVARSHAEVLEEVVPQARRAELPGRHLAVYEDPAPWADLLRRFVSETARDDRPA